MSLNGGKRNNSSGLSGITRTIREELNFLDDTKWKEFSNRRLELIDRFNLSSKKASEQDHDITQIASMLMEEFRFPAETLGKFDKLVRAAVQSVRRNRKRSSRARVNHNRFVMVDDKGNQQQQASSTRAQDSDSTGNTPSLLFPDDETLHSHGHRMNVNVNVPGLLVAGGSGTLSPSTPSLSSMSNSLATSPNATLLPSIKSVLTPSLGNSAASGTKADTFNPSLPQSFSKQKLLKSIQNSKTCLLLSDNSPVIHELNLLRLGKSIITASISFVLERFFQDISKESVTYLSEKLNDSLTLSKILRSLGFDSNEVRSLNDVQATNLFYKLVGCCVKDFGFDANCYNLCEIFHEVILNEYPLVGTQITKISKESLFMPLLPMIPKDANKETSKDVKLKFASKVLEFKYFPLSNAPPTFLEIVENGKVAFGINKGSDGWNKMYRLKFNGRDVSSDGELEKLFKDLALQSLEFELYEAGQEVQFTPLL
jgi:hypothetical protein